MNLYIFFAAMGLVIVTLPEALANESVNWAQPPLICIEQASPELKTSECPTAINREQFSKKYPLETRICDDQKILDAEAARPNSQPPKIWLPAYLEVHGVEQAHEKIQAIYDAAEAYDVPPHILHGALKEESSLAALGVGRDFGNFSCGMGQLNYPAWCQWIKTQPIALQEKLGWPRELGCSDHEISLREMNVFYTLAFHGQNRVENIGLQSTEFASISSSTLQTELKKIGILDANMHEKALRSFVNHCTDFHYGVKVTAFLLKKIFTEDVPSSLKDTEKYSTGESFQLACARPYGSHYYPLNTGWLLANGIYNLGPTSGFVFQHYFKTEIEKNPTQVFHPQDLIEGIYYGGRYNSKTGLLDFLDEEEKPKSIDWFHTCVNQRYIANIANWGTAFGKSVVHSYDTEDCYNGLMEDELHRPYMPAARQVTSGVK